MHKLLGDKKTVLAWHILLLLLLSIMFLKPVDAERLAPGYSSGLGYVLPEVGSYNLPAIGKAADGDVIDTKGRHRRLYDVIDDKYALIAFMYSTCDDVNGCPLTSYVFYQIKAAMKEDPVLAQRLKLISFSFDPETDTPEVMRLYGSNFDFEGQSGNQWEFLTTESEQQLDPLLSAYNQGIQRQISSSGDISGFAHVLRVFLVDPDKHIRNIYSVAFLHKAILLTDVRTLIMQEHSNNKVASSDAATLSVPGDDKTGYESRDYETRSLAVQKRRGVSADLFGVVQQPMLGLPPIPQPELNRITRAKINLGRKLFFDRRLSLNDTFSCAMCHIPEQGFTNNELAVAVGLEGRSGRRNTPSVYNSAYAKLLFHDGREYTLEQQVWGPLLDRNEMANPSVGTLLEKIRNIPEYDHLFERAFNGRSLSIETLGMALATYQRVLISANSRFDRWYYGKDDSAMNKQQRRGFELFTGKAGCSTCHTVGEDYALFTDNELHNTGIGYRESMQKKPPREKIQLAPGVFVEVEQSIIESVSERVRSDLGRYEITQNPHDRWKYKTPSLRNVALTPPYMHNGSLAGLREVVEFYNRGGEPNELLDSLIKPLRLSESEIDALVAFMEALNGSNVNTIVSDSFAAPVGDVTRNDPNWVHGTSVEVD